MDIKIVVATHKQAAMPADDMYLPLQVGAVGSPGLGLQRDDVGENISNQHDMFAELTGMYWAWKNLYADYIGLVHYRRYFRGHGVDGFKQIANKDDVQALLQIAPVILPRKRNYYVETVYSQFAHAHDVMNLDLAGCVVKEKYPEYYKAFEKLKNRRSAHICNMCVMRKDYFYEYCNWLFDILLEVGLRLPDNQEPRCLGYIGERLLDVWLETRQVRYVEQNMVCYGVENTVFKGIKMLKRKFFRRK